MEVEKQDCVFCQYKATVKPEHLVHEENGFAIFLSKKPMSRGHCIIVPTGHVQAVQEVDTKRLFDLADKLAGAIEHAMKTDVVNMQVTYGSVIRQALEHFHVHMIPVYQKNLGGIQPPEISVDEMDQIASSIKEEFRAWK